MLSKLLTAGDTKLKFVLFAASLFAGTFLAGSAFETTRFGTFRVNAVALAFGAVALALAWEIYRRGLTADVSEPMSIVAILRKGEVVTVKKSTSAQNVVLTVLEEGCGRTTRKDW